MARTRKRPFVTGELAPGCTLARADRAVADRRGLARRVGDQSGCGLPGVPRGDHLRRGLHLWLKRRTWLNIVVRRLRRHLRAARGSAGGRPAAAARAGDARDRACSSGRRRISGASRCTTSSDYVAAGVPMLPAIASDRVDEPGDPRAHGAARGLQPRAGLHRPRPRLRRLRGRGRCVVPVLRRAARACAQPRRGARQFPRLARAALAPPASARSPTACSTAGC